MAPTADEVSRSREDLTLEAAYRAEFVTPEESPDALVQIPGGENVKRRVGDLRALTMADLAARVTEHALLRRADDVSRMEALRFVERRLSESDKIASYAAEGAFQGFLRRVLSNLILDWLRSPRARAELRRTEHESDDVFSDAEEMTLPREDAERSRRMGLHHLLAVRAIQTLPPGRGVPLMVALWPAYEHLEADLAVVSAFAHCHETSGTQGDARACDSGKRCGLPSPEWKVSHEAELVSRKTEEPQGLSRKAIAEVLRIGDGKPLAKREGAVCERISKGRLMLLDALRRSGVKGLS